MIRRESCREDEPAEGVKKGQNRVESQVVRNDFDCEVEGSLLAVGTSEIIPQLTPLDSRATQQHFLLLVPEPIDVIALIKAHEM